MHHSWLTAYWKDTESRQITYLVPVTEVFLQQIVHAYCMILLRFGIQSSAAIVEGFLFPVLAICY
jgi:hypothetical protein